MNTRFNLFTLGIKSLLCVESVLNVRVTEIKRLCLHGTHSLVEKVMSTNKGKKGFLVVKEELLGSQVGKSCLSP
jgi:hypothetical protein